MSMDDVRKIFRPWFVGNGLKATSSKNMFIEDHGIFMIMAELQPLHNIGFFMNIGVKFMWKTYEILSYDYTYKDLRVYGKEDLSQTIGGAVMFDSSTVDEEISYMQCSALERINEYRKHSDINVLEDRLANRSDTAVLCNEGYADRDIDLANVRMIMGKVEEAKSLYINAANHKYPYRFAQELISENFDKIFFDERMLQIINENRAGLSRKFKIKLESIDSFEYLK